MKNGYFRYWLILQETLRAIWTKRLLGLSAEIAYNGLFAIFPIILAVFTALSLFGTSLQAVFKQFSKMYEDILPDSVWLLLHNFIYEVTDTPSKKLFSFSFLFAVWIASSAVSSTMNALDEIYQIPLSQRRKFWQAKGLAIVLTLAIIVIINIISFFLVTGNFLLKTSLKLITQLYGISTGIFLISKIWDVFGVVLILTIICIIILIIGRIRYLKANKNHRYRKPRLIFLVIAFGKILLLLTFLALGFIQSLIPQVQVNSLIGFQLVWLWQFLTFPLAVIIVCLVFAFLYRIAGSRWSGKIPIFPGAVLGSFLWGVFAIGFRFYVSNYGQYNRVYGAVTAVIVLMLWLQLSALLMLLGAQYNVILGEKSMENSEIY